MQNCDSHLKWYTKNTIHIDTKKPTMPIYKNKFFIALVIFVILVVCFLLFGKNLISPPRASENLRLYNIDSRYGDGFNFTYIPARTIRWQTLPVMIFNKAEIKNLQNIIDEWNQAMGRKVFVLGGSDSPIIISDDPKVAPGGTLNYSYRNYLLTSAQITVNASWLNNPEIADKEVIKNPDNVLKFHLGRALGFFGRTTDDPDGVMDLDWPAKEKTVITPFVASVIKELYSLPAGTRPAETVNVQLRWLVKKYNIDSRSVDYKWDTIKEIEEYKNFGKSPDSKMPAFTMRWRSLPVAVYDKDNLVPDLQAVIDEWNQAMGQEVLKMGEPDSEIMIENDPKQGPYELGSITSKKAGLLDQIRIVNNPNWVSSSKIKHQLGHALGFFGHTTDDPDGIMDVDYDRQKNISPLVISVLKELYKLPPGVRIVDEFGRPEKEVLVLRQAIKKYNERGSNLPVRMVRWREFPVSIYNQANVADLQNILDEWNQAMGQKVFTIGGSDSQIVIETDSSPNPLPFPIYQAETKNYLITIFKIKVNPQSPNLHYLKHQLGHALGFFGHTDEDDPNGIMHQDHRRTDTIISPFVISALKELYNLSPGVLISY